jgi:hypothetical protein
MKTISTLAFVSVLLFVQSSPAFSNRGSKSPHFVIPLSPRAEAEVRSQTEVCTTPLCRDFSKYLLESLVANYSTTDPCVDFEKWSCDGWRASHTYRAEQSRLSVTSVQSDGIIDLLHAIMEGPYAENSTFTGQIRDLDKQNFKKMQTAYRTCMNEDAIKAYGVAPIRKILNEFEKLYPVKGASPRAMDEELTNAVIWLEKHGVSGLISTGTGVSYRASDFSILTDFEARRHESRHCHHLCRTVGDAVDEKVL